MKEIRLTDGTMRRDFDILPLHSNTEELLEVRLFKV